MTSVAPKCLARYLPPPTPFFIAMEFLERTMYLSCVFLLSPAALVPGQVQNLRSTLDTNIPSLTLNWNKPSNVKTAEEVTAYYIYFRPAASWWRKDYYKMTSTKNCFLRACSVSQNPI